jgi:hypothetical protein
MARAPGRSELAHDRKESRAALAASAEAAGELDFPGLKASALSRRERAADQIAERCILLSRHYRQGRCLSSCTSTGEIENRLH